MTEAINCSNNEAAFKSLQEGLGTEIIKKVFNEMNLSVVAPTIFINNASELQKQPKPRSPCGSEKRIRNCHGKDYVLTNMINGPNHQYYLEDYSNLSTK